MAGLIWWTFANHLRREPPKIPSVTIETPRLKAVFWYSGNYMKDMEDNNIHPSLISMHACMDKAENKLENAVLFNGQHTLLVNIGNVNFGLHETVPCAKKSIEKANDLVSNVEWLQEAFDHYFTQYMKEN